MNYKEQLKDQNRRMGYLLKNTKVAPAMLGAANENMVDGPLTVKEKEYVMLGIAIAIRCEDCIRAHVKNCIDLGVTEEEVAEVADAAAMMGGGPSIAYGSFALDVYKGLTE